jgi:hypothetical protein
MRGKIKYINVSRNLRKKMGAPPFFINRNDAMLDWVESTQSLGFWTIWLESKIEFA